MATRHKHQVCPSSALLCASALPRPEAGSVQAPSRLACPTICGTYTVHSTMLHSTGRYEQQFQPSSNIVQPHVKSTRSSGAEEAPPPATCARILRRVLGMADCQIAIAHALCCAGLWSCRVVYPIPCTPGFAWGPETRDGQNLLIAHLMDAQGESALLLLVGARSLLTTVNSLVRKEQASVLSKLMGGYSYLCISIRRSISRRVFLLSHHRPSKFTSHIIIINPCPGGSVGLAGKPGLHKMIHSVCFSRPFRCVIASVSIFVSLYGDVSHALQDLSQSSERVSGSYDRWQNNAYCVY